MQKVMAVLMLGFAVMCSGCATGPLGSVGVLSELYGQRCERVSLERARLRQSAVPVEQREKIFEARNLGMSPNEIAAGLTLKLHVVREALSAQTYRWYEYLGQFVTAVGDLVIYRALGVAAKEGIDSLKSDDDKPETQKASEPAQIRADNVTIINGDGNHVENEQVPVE